MEEMHWITTPKCSKCKPEPCFEHRYACIGCDKLHVRPKPKPRRTVLKHTIRPPERDSRDQTVVALRSQGLSYGGIADTLGIPRSTVQSIILRKAGAAIVRNENSAETDGLVETGNALETAEIHA